VCINFILGVGFAIGVLSHLLKLDDALIGVIACLSKVFAGIVFAFAPSEFYFYVGKHELYFQNNKYINIIDVQNFFFKRKIICTTCINSITINKWLG